MSQSICRRSLGETAEKSTLMHKKVNSRYSIRQNIKIYRYKPSCLPSSFLKRREGGRKRGGEEGGRKGEGRGGEGREREGSEGEGKGKGLFNH